MDLKLLDIILIVLIIAIIYYVVQNKQKVSDLINGGIFKLTHPKSSSSSQTQPQTQIQPQLQPQIQPQNRGLTNPMGCKLPQNVADFYKTRYTSSVDYQPPSDDTRQGLRTLKEDETGTLEERWKKKMDMSMNKSYTDAKGKIFATVSESDENLPEPKYKFNQIPKEGMSNNMPTMDTRLNRNDDEDVEKMKNDRYSPLEVNDLLPNPCLGKNKDWTNVFAECENLLGGQNFVRIEDEHFTNQVLDTRCTRYMSTDLRREPSIETDEKRFATWMNNPSTCKSIYDTIRPSLDGDD